MHHIFTTLEFHSHLNAETPNLTITASQIIMLRWYNNAEWNVRGRFTQNSSTLLWLSLHPGIGLKMCIVFSPTNVDRDDSLAFEIICRYFYRLKWELGSSQGMYSCSGRLTCHSPLSPSSVSATTKSLKDLSYVVPRLTQHSVFDVWPLDACTKLSLVSHTSSESASSDRQVALSLRSVTVVVFR